MLNQARSVNLMRCQINENSSASVCSVDFSFVAQHEAKHMTWKYDGRVEERCNTICSGRTISLNLSPAFPHSGASH